MAIPEERDGPPRPLHTGRTVVQSLAGTGDYGLLQGTFQDVVGAGAERWLCVAKQRAFPTLESAGSSSRGPRFFLGKAADLTDRGVRQPAGFDDVAFNHRFGFRRTVGHDISCF